MGEVIFGDSYIFDSEKKYVVAEKKLSLSGDSFNITDSDGNKVFKADGSVLQDKKAIKLVSLADKSVVCTIGKDKSSGEFYIKKGDSLQVMFSFKPSDGFKASTSVDAKIEIFLGGGGAYPAYYISRIIDDKTFAVMQAAQNKEIGRIQHDLGSGKHDVWTCIVPPRTDAAFMIATTLLVDEVMES